MPEKYFDVKVKNNSGQTVEFRFPDNQEGRDLAATLKGKARRDELDSVSEVKGTKKGPEYEADSEPPRRRGRPVDGLFNASAPVETDGNATVTDEEAVALTEPITSEASAKAKK